VEQWAISLNSFSQQNTATHNWIFVEDTTLVIGSEQQAQKNSNASQGSKQFLVA